MVNERGEELVALNVERINYWLSEGATCSTDVAELLGKFSMQKSNLIYIKNRFYPWCVSGLAGILPIHPNSYVKAWRNRKKVAEEMEKAQQQNQQQQESNES